MPVRSVRLLEDDRTIDISGDQAVRRRAERRGKGSLGHLAADEHERAREQDEREDEDHADCSGRPIRPAQGLRAFPRLAP